MRNPTMSLVIALIAGLLLIAPFPRTASARPPLKVILKCNDALAAQATIQLFDQGINLVASRMLACGQSPKKDNAVLYQVLKGTEGTYYYSIESYEVITDGGQTSGAFCLYPDGLCQWIDGLTFFLPPSLATITLVNDAEPN